MKLKRGFFIVLVLSIALTSALTILVSADESRKNIDYYQKEYGETYLGRGYNLLENSVSFKDTSKIITDNNASVFEYEGDNSLYNIPATRTDNERHFSLSKIVSNNQLDCVNKYIKLYEKGISTSSEENDDWNVGKLDIDFIKETMNQLDIDGTERIDYSIIKADTSICSLEISSEDYGSHVRKEFLDDLFSMSAREVLYKYGTHVLTSVAMGSQIESMYTLISNDSMELVEIENYISQFMDQYYSDTAEYTSIDTKLKDSDVKKIQEFVNSDERKVTVNNTLIAKMCNNKGVPFEGDYVKWDEETRNRPLFIGAAGNGLEELSEIIRKIDSKHGYSKEDLEAKSREIAQEYNIYMSEVKQAHQEELDKKYGSFMEGCIEIYATPIAIEENHEFDPNYALDEDVQKLHNGYSLGTVKLYNVTETGREGIFSFDDSNHLKVMYHVGNYHKELPLGDGQAIKHELAKTPTEIDNIKDLGTGGYYTIFEYMDGVSEIVSSGENLFRSENIGKAITIVNMNDNKFLRAKVDAHGGLKTIKINIMYNTKAKYEGKFFKVSQDWLCPYEVYFE